MPDHPLDLQPPGLVVNALKGDASERRANGWLEWDGSLDGLDAALLGVPFDGASTVRTGSRHGPDAVRRMLPLYTTYSSDLHRNMNGLRAADVGDVRVVVTDMPGTFERVTSAVAALVGRGIRVLALGGDHSVSWPLIEGVCRALPGKRIGVVHFDAHHDLRESHLGALSSGVPFRKALELPGSPLRGRNLVQIGMVEFGNAPTHADYARRMGVTVFPMLRVWRDGLMPLVEEALAIAGDGTDAIYVSIDIDAVDQGQAPGTASPNPFGIDARDLQLALRRLAGDPKTVAADVVEINPPFDHDDMTARLGATLALNFLMGLALRRESSA
jgi:formimidoylglutamase